MDLMKERPKIFRGGKKICGVPKKFWGLLKKKVVKKIWGNMAKKGDFRHISEIYGLEQSFFRSKKSKK